MSKKLVSLLIVLIFMAGCAGTSDKTKTQNQGAGIGAAGGAAVGAIIGQLIGRDTKSTIIGAAIGGLAGAVGGGLYANHVVNQKGKYASEEAYLNDCIASADKVNTETQQYNDTLRSEMQSLDDEANEMVAQYNHKEIKKTDLVAKQKEIDTRHSEAEKKLKRALAEITLQKEARNQLTSASQEQLDQMDNQIKELEKTVDELNGQAQALAAISQNLSV